MEKPTELDTNVGAYFGGMTSTSFLAINLSTLAANLSATTAATTVATFLLANATTSGDYNFTGNGTAFEDVARPSFSGADFAANQTQEEEPELHLYHMHDVKHKPQRIKFFETQFDHVQTQLTFAFWFFTITIAKIVFQRFENIKGVLPDSALLIVLGSIFGGIFHFVFPDEEIYLQPDWFFLYFLPPIALDAGYFMPNKEFFQNIGTITTYAVVGTLFNIAGIGLTLFAFREYFYGQPPTIDLLVFATLISAVDPVAVICVFEEVHVNQVLFICVFGESLLNDAVTIVLYHTLNAISEVGTANVVYTDYGLAVVSFLWVSFGGITVGLLWAVLTGIATKCSATVSVVQPLICLLFPYLAYLCAESLGLSGILAIVVCGMLMKQYVVANISHNSKVTVDYFMKTLSSSCEAVIFVFLGLSAVSKNHVFDFTFIGLTLISCLVFRFIGVGFITYLLNLKRMQKINFVDQFIMGYGGIRGAVCYGLVMSLSLDIVTGKHMFATTTIIVILFTVFIQGGTIKKLVTYLKVKQHKVYKKSVFEMISDNLLNHATGGIEGIAGLHGEYWLRMTIERFNDTYIKPYIMVKREAKGMKIVNYNEEIQVDEALSYLKQHGSFAGMPTVQSKADLQQPQVGLGLYPASYQQAQKIHPNNVGQPVFTAGPPPVSVGYSSANGVQRRSVHLNMGDQNYPPKQHLLQQQRRMSNNQQHHQLLQQRQRQQQQQQPQEPIQLSESALSDDSIPRNQSISCFVRDKFAEVNSPGPMYSRHYLQNDAAGRNLFFGNMASSSLDGRDDVVVDESENYKTYPYSKSSQKDLLILNIRKASRTNSGGGGGANGGGAPASAPPGGGGGGGIATTCFGCGGANGSNGGNGSGNASLYSSPAREGGNKPKFMITSDIADFTAPDEAAAPAYYFGDHSSAPALPTANGTGCGTSYSIGRFEVGSDMMTSSSSAPAGATAGTGGTPVPSRKHSAGARGRGLTDENACLLLPIEEQDEQHTVRSLRNVSMKFSPKTTGANN